MECSLPKAGESRFPYLLAMLNGCRSAVNEKSSRTRDSVDCLSTRDSAARRRSIGSDQAAGDGRPKNPPRQAKSGQFLPHPEARCEYNPACRAFLRNGLRLGSHCETGIGDYALQTGHCESGTPRGATKFLEQASRSEHRATNFVAVGLVFRETEGLEAIPDNPVPRGGGREQRTVAFTRGDRL
jgi:hypothetical protein